MKSVEQFDVPRHTARIDFHDKVGVMAVMGLGSTKVKCDVAGCVH